mmetsp:Transcript_38513/g.80715  ORF Transcript_38513/g.80715 Transcript_38513/m.80715 type:complete len:219 (+) Transcript_38513:1242-1898(+)
MICSSYRCGFMLVHGMMMLSYDNFRSNVRRLVVVLMMRLQVVINCFHVRFHFGVHNDVLRRRVVDLVVHARVDIHDANVIEDVAEAGFGCFRCRVSFHCSRRGLLAGIQCRLFLVDVSMLPPSPLDLKVGQWIFYFDTGLSLHSLHRRREDIIVMIMMAHYFFPGFTLHGGREFRIFDLDIVMLVMLVMTLVNGDDVVLDDANLRPGGFVTFGGIRFS